MARRWAGSHLGLADQVGTTVGYSSYRRSREPCSRLISGKKFTKTCGFACALSNKSFPGGSVGKNLPANVGDAGQISGLRRTPRGGNGNPLQYSCLKNPMTEESSGL